ncbi:helix-turn-helix domain-containing protein [Streptomyces virginiae]|uniref:helix-turn-helix domain-containing protein n=1 Tax=Streptomyces virginiae TaxID=1961 RepID=UPI0035D937E5
MVETIERQCEHAVQGGEEMAGRPQKPIPGDAPQARAALTEALRDVVSRRGKPTVVLARQAGLGRSTLAHALGGRRIPSRETLARILHAVDLAPEERQMYFELWERAAADERSVAPSSPSASDAQADLVVVEGDKVWLVEAKHTGRGEAEQPRSRALDAAEHRSAILEVARAQNALNVAMDRLEQATADVAAARVVLREAMHRASRSIAADNEGARRDAEAAIRIADETGTAR